MRWINASRKRELFWSSQIPKVEFTNDSNQEGWEDECRTLVARLASWRRGVHRGSCVSFCYCLSDARHRDHRRSRAAYPRGGRCRRGDRCLFVSVAAAKNKRPSCRDLVFAKAG